MDATFDLWKLTKWTLFYALVVFIVVVSVFPFYYAILTSFKSGTALFQINYWPTDFSLNNYWNVLNSGSFPRNLLNSIFVSAVTVILALFLVNAILNVGWSLLFFRLQRPDWALIEVAFLWLSIVALIVAIAPLSRLAAWLLAPYLAWVAFAAVLNFAIVRLNGPFG